MFLAVRLYCSFVMEYDIHTVLDLATLATTLWVIYMIRFKLRSSYMEDKDNFAIYYVVSCLSFACHDFSCLWFQWTGCMPTFSSHLNWVEITCMLIFYSTQLDFYVRIAVFVPTKEYNFVMKFFLQVIPCAVLALFIHPSTSHHLLNRIFWAFCVYLEAVSVLPQLRVMQNTKVQCFKWNMLMIMWYSSYSQYQLLSLERYKSSHSMENYHNSRNRMYLCLWDLLNWTNNSVFLYNSSVLLAFQIVEPFTAHYVFALGVARFLSCAHWVLQVWSCWDLFLMLVLSRFIIWIWYFVLSYVLKIIFLWHFTVSSVTFISVCSGLFFFSQHTIFGW